MGEGDANATEPETAPSRRGFLTGSIAAAAGIGAGAVTTAAIFAGQGGEPGARPRS